MKYYNDCVFGDDDDVMWYYGGDAFSRAEPGGVPLQNILQLFFHYIFFRSFFLYYLPSSSNYHDYVYIMEIWCEQKSCQARSSKKMYRRLWINLWIPRRYFHTCHVTFLYSSSFSTVDLRVSWLVLMEGRLCEFIFSTAGIFFWYWFNYNDQKCIYTGRYYKSHPIPKKMFFYCSIYMVN